MQSICGLKRKLERLKFSKNLISKLRFQENFVQICLESSIELFKVKSNALWSKERTNVKTTKTVKSVNNEMQ